MNKLHRQRRTEGRWLRLLQAAALVLLVVVGMFWVLGKWEERRAELAPVQAAQTRARERARENLERVRDVRATRAITITQTRTR